MISNAELVARVAVGALLGGVIGYERDVHHRPVGLRTHLLVALASATFMVLSAEFVYWQHYGKDDLVEVDASRIAASVVSAVGFIAGGAILRTGLNVHGLTTAAGLWLVTAIGMCAGAGMYALSFSVTGMGIAALTVLRRFEDKNDHVLGRRVLLVLTGAEVLDNVMVVLKGQGVAVSDFDYDRRLDDEARSTQVVFDMDVPDTVGVAKVIASLEALQGVCRVQVERRR